MNSGIESISSYEVYDILGRLLISDSKVSSNQVIVELQKSIEKFRIHTLKHSKFDKGIVALWLLTLSPIYLKLFFSISIFSNQNHFILFILIIVALGILVKIFPFDIYKKWDLELSEAETKLNEIKEFEIE
jgi:uncharacterized membrane protein